MKIGIIGSMQYTEKMLEAKDELVKLGHDAFVTNLAARRSSVKPIVINGDYSLIK